MAVFDRELNHLDPQNVEESFSALENYIAYMRERLEFNNSNLTRSMSSAGTSTAEMVLIVVALQTSVAALQSSVTAMQGRITALETKTEALEERIQALEDKGGTT